jgi:uncharacterized membrane protein YfcA
MDAPIALIVGGAAAAGFVQGLTGFGFGLVAMSFWAWTLEPQLAAVLAVVGAFSGQVLALFTVRRAFDARRLAPYLAGGFAGLPLGLWLLPHVDAAAFRIGVGTLLAVWCPVMLVSARLPRVTFGGRWADALAGACGGFMGPLGGFTGAIPTLWCTLRGWERDAQRAVIQNFNLAMLGTTLVSYVAGGLVTRPMWPLLAVTVPALALPALLGMKVYVGISPQAFRQVVLVLLTATGIVMLASGLR